MLMEEVSARAQLADSATEVEAHGIATTIPRQEVEEALRADDGPAELILDVAKGNGGEPVRRTVAVAWDRTDLEKLLQQSEGDRITLFFDREALQRAVEAGDVEAHGFREKALLLTVVAGMATGAGGAYGAPLAGGGTGADMGTAYSAVENVRAEPGGASTMGADYSAIEEARAGEAGAASDRAGEAGMPRAMPSDYAAAGAGSTPDYAGIEQARAGETGAGQSDRAGEPGMPRAMPSDYAAASTPDYSGIEQARAGETSTPSTMPADYSAVEGVRGEPGAPPDYSAIEGVRGEPAPSMARDYSAIEGVRTPPAPATVGAEEGGGISAPSPAEAAAIAGGVALAITGAAFAARRRRVEPA
jgi:hypothetical protein